MAGTKQRNANPYFVGEREVQKGKRAGIKEPLMVLIAADSATEIGLTKEYGFPQTIAGTTYEIKNGGVFANSKRKKGDGPERDYTRIVPIKRGSKAVTIYLTTDEAYSYTQQGKPVSGRRPKSLQIGFPSGASAIHIHDFLKKASKVKSFSLGGSPYDILRAAVGGAT